MVEDLVVHLAQMFCHFGPVEPMDETVLIRALRICDRSIWKSGCLGNAVDDIHSEPIAAFIQPEPHHIPNRVPNLRIVPIKVRLRDVEDMQVVFLQLFVPLPARSAEDGTPVVWLFAVFAFSSPNVPVFLVASYHCVLKPLMLV